MDGSPGTPRFAPRPARPAALPGRVVAGSVLTVVVGVLLSAFFLLATSAFLDFELGGVGGVVAIGLVVGVAPVVLAVVTLVGRRLTPVRVGVLIELAALLFVTGVSVVQGMGLGDLNRGALILLTILAATVVATVLVLTPVRRTD